jgi:hypothetical protein
MEKSKTPVLCYVNESWAYFTTKNLSEQWGDDWNDAPYEHNAEAPYEYSENDKSKGLKPWDIVKVAWEGDFLEPSYSHNNSPWSVQQINSGAIAWLRSNPWVSKEKPIVIAAGTSLEDFCHLIKQGGGKVYLQK